jgi:hypothetical protein
LPTLSDEVIQQRARDHIENHVRSLEQQILDALLRIEELLTPTEVAPAAPTQTKVPEKEAQKSAPAKTKGRRGYLD